MTAEQRKDMPESPPAAASLPAMQPDAARDDDAPDADEAAPKRSGFNAWLDRNADGIRRATPAGIVNSGSQIKLGLQAGADTMSIWSAMRKGSSSPWRLVASVITLAGEGLGIVYKEKPYTVEERESYKRMSWPQYLGVKTLQAFHPKDHIGETVGLAFEFNGIFTALSGIAQSSKRSVSWEIFQGVMTTVAGACLSYMPNREKAWQLAIAAFWTRAPVSAQQSYVAYRYGYPDKNIAPGDWQQGAKWVLNQTSNLVGFVYGGIKKLPDNTIVRVADDEEQRELAEQRRRHRWRHSRDPKPPHEAVPATQVSQVVSEQRAANDPVRGAA
ncbi:MAG: hypothetical protein WDN72_04495 [Alphaproteobacteria bacterium]